MHQVKTKIGSLGLPARWLGVAMIALTALAVVALVFWVWAEPSPWATVLMLALQVLAVVAVGKILIERFPTLRRAASRSKGAFSFQVRRVRQQESPEELTQAQWDDIRVARRKCRRMILFLTSAVGMVLLITLVLRNWGFWGKILTPLLIYIYGWTVASRINVTKPFPGMTLERVGADVGEPVSTPPAQLGWFAVALRWIRDDFPPKEETKEKSRRQSLAIRIREIWAALAFLTIPTILVGLGRWSLLALGLIGAAELSFWLFWALIGWAAIRYTLGAGENPNVFISKPKLGLIRVEIVVLYNNASAFNQGVTETHPGGAVDFNPGVLALGGGEVKELMNFLWCLEWFMEKVLEAGAVARGRRPS